MRRVVRRSMGGVSVGDAPNHVRHGGQATTKIVAEADGAKNEGRSRMGSARSEEWWSLGVVECRMAVQSPLGRVLRTLYQGLAQGTFSWHPVRFHRRYQPLTVSNRGT